MEEGFGEREWGVHSTGSTQEWHHDESLQRSEMGASSEEADPDEAAASLRGLSEQRNVSPSRLA